MPLEDLLVKVKEEKDAEIERLKKDYQENLLALDKKKNQELEEIKARLEEDFQRNKEDFLKKKEREHSFILQMKELEIKKEVFEKAKEEILSKLENLSFEDKKKIYLKRLQQEKSFLEESSEIVISKKNKEKLEPIIRTLGFAEKIREADSDFGDGFLVKGPKWTLSITLEEIVNKEIDNNKKEFVDLLFKGL